VIGTNKNRCAETVSSALDNSLEDVRSLCSSTRDPVLIAVAVDLRSYDKPDVRVIKVTDRALQEPRLRNMIWIRLTYQIILIFLAGSPGVVIAGLGLRSIRSVRLALLVQLRYAFTREVTDAQLLAQRSKVWVITLV
jgi:hypothetical protein